MSFGARQALVNWVVTYDWETDPVGIYNRPQELAEVWPLVRIYYMKRFGPNAHDLNHLMGFLEFMQKAPPRGTNSVSSPVMLNTAIPVTVNDSKQNGPTLDYNPERVELTAKDNEDTDVQNLRARMQFLFGKSPEYFRMQGEEDDGFQVPGLIIVKVKSGSFEATGKGKRIAKAIQRASEDLLKELKDLTPNLPEILNNIEFTVTSTSSS